MNYVTDSYLTTDPSDYAEYFAGYWLNHDGNSEAPDDGDCYYADRDNAEEMATNELESLAKSEGCESFHVRCNSKGIYELWMLTEDEDEMTTEYSIEIEEAY